MYRIIGADGKEYGPISETQLRQWIVEGRVNAQTRVVAEGTTEWKTVADFPQLATAVPGAAAPAAPPPPMTAIPSMPGGLYSPAADRVNGPAIGLIIIGALNILGALVGLGLPALVLAAMTSLKLSLDSLGLLKGERPFLFLALVLLPAPAVVAWRGGWRQALPFTAVYGALAFAAAFLTVRVMLLG